MAPTTRPITITHVASVNAKSLMLLLSRGRFSRGLVAFDYHPIFIDIDGDPVVLNGSDHDDGSLPLVILPIGGVGMVDPPERRSPTR